MRPSCDSSFGRGEERTPGIIAILPAFKRLAFRQPPDARKIFVMGCRLEHVRGQVLACENVRLCLCRLVVLAQVHTVIGIEAVAGGGMSNVRDFNHRLYPEIWDVWLHLSQFVRWKYLLDGGNDMLGSANEKEVRDQRWQYLQVALC